MKMRNILAAGLVFVLGFAVVNCSRSSDVFEDIDRISEVGIDSLVMQVDTVALGSSITARVYMKMNSGCETFYKFNYQGEGNTRQIKASKLKNTDVCGAPRSVNSQFVITPQSPGTYNLQFWNGTAWKDREVVVR